MSTTTVRSPLYQQRYLSFINSCKNQTIIGYSETHHIVPRCLGGTDKPSNLIKLTARQHYVAHWMLWKTYSSHKLMHAFIMMYNSARNQERYIPTSSRIYEKLKLEHGTYMKTLRISCEHCGKVCSPSRHNLYHGDNCLQNPNLTPERLDELTKMRSEIGNNGNKRAKEIVTCPHCGKSGGNGAMRRKHFDNCLSNPNLSDEVRQRLMETENTRRIGTSKGKTGIPSPMKGTKRMIMNGNSIHVHPCDFSARLDEGWSFVDAKMAEIADRVSM